MKTPTKPRDALEKLNDYIVKVECQHNELLQMLGEILDMHDWPTEWQWEKAKELRKRIKFV